MAEIASCKTLYRAAAALRPELDNDTDMASRLTRWLNGSQKGALMRYRRLYGEGDCAKILGKPFPQH